MRHWGLLKMALINKLSAIGNAIREKTGGTELMTLDAMPDAIKNISGGGGSVDVEPIVLRDNQSYGCSGQLATNYINMYGDTITTENIKDTSFMFQNFTLERIPFALNFDNVTSRAMNQMFYQCSNLTEIPEINNAYPSSIVSIFEGCSRVRELPDDFGADWDWSRLQSYAYSNMSNIFARCCSLRRIPMNILRNLWGIQTSAAYTPMYGTFSQCFALDEVRGFPVHKATLTSNAMAGIVKGCEHLQAFTFETNEDGSAKTANWKAQVLDMADKTFPVGYTNIVNNVNDSVYNSGISSDKEVKDDATYQALKNDPDWFASSVSYSRYNHDSAVETINSLPDTSASGGVNTIKFIGVAGSKTDGGAINTLTETEIAVATAKGWTISFV